MVSNSARKCATRFVAFLVLFPIVAFVTMPFSFLISMTEGMCGAYITEVREWRVIWYTWLRTVRRKLCR